MTCLVEYQKEALRRSLHLKRRGCRRRLHFSQDEQAHLSKMSKLDTDSSNGNGIHWTVDVVAH